MTGNSQNPSRRSFLKVGAGVVAGAVVAGVGVAAYESSVIGTNNSNSSSTVASLQDQLTTTQAQLNDTANSLTAANSTITSLNSVLESTQSSLSAANSQNASLTQQLTVAQGSVSTLQNQVSSASAQASSLQVQLDTMSGFLTLNLTEQTLIAAVAEAIIPTDSTGVGANEAGVIYFIDRQLATDYGKSGNMYMQGPFVLPGVTSSITLPSLTGTSIVYSAGTFAPPAGGGYSFQYPLNMREFWRVGLAALEAYSTSAYGGSFESLSSANQAQALSDLWANKPTTFGEILPSDFAWELFYMVWAGFLTDPLYGGNRNMVGWQYVAFNGVNFGNFYGEGHTPQELMLATTPTRLQPASLAQYQKGSA